MSTIPTSGPYHNLIQGFLGYLPESQKQSIWQSFLEKNHITGAPASDDVQQLTSFSEYISRIYDSTIPLAYSDLGKTRVVLTIFDIILTMMNSMTDAQKVMSDNVAFFTKKQKEITDLALKTPLYEGWQPYGEIPKTTVKVHQDPAQHDLGYANFTMKDILTYLDSTLSRDPTTGQLVTVTSKTMKMSLMTPTRGESNPPRYLNIGVVRDVAPGTYRFFADLVNKGSDDVVSHREITIDESLPLDTKIAIIGAKLWELYQANPMMMTTPPALPWAVFNTSIKDQPHRRFTIDVRYAFPHLSPNTDFGTAIQNDTNEQKAIAAMRIRAETNAYLQTAIDAMKTKKDILTDLSDSSQRTVSSSGQGLQQMANIYKAIITNLNNIMNALFK